MVARLRRATPTAGRVSGLPLPIDGPVCESGSDPVADDPIWRETVSDPHNHRPDAGDSVFDHRLSRETLLRGAAGTMLGMSPLVAAACGGGSSTPSATGPSTSGGSPVRGGRLRAGFVGAGTAETMMPYQGVTPIDESRVQNLYDPLS